LNTDFYQEPGKLVFSLPTNYNLIGCNTLSTCQLKIIVINYPNMRHVPIATNYSLSLKIISKQKEVKRIEYQNIPSPTSASLISSFIEQTPKNQGAEKVTLNFQMIISVYIPQGGRIRIDCDTSNPVVPNLTLSTFEFVQAPDGSFFSPNSDITVNLNFNSLIESIQLHPDHILIILKDPIPRNVTLEMVLDGLSSFSGLTVLTDGKYILPSVFTFTALSEHNRPIIEDSFSDLSFLPETPVSLLYAQIEVLHILKTTNENQIILLVQNTNKLLLNGAIRIILPAEFRSQNNSNSQKNRIMVNGVLFENHRKIVESFSYSVIDDTILGELQINIIINFEWPENTPLKSKFFSNSICSNFQFQFLMLLHLLLHL
jgi:DNA-binding transcriptional regulator/RsmH inhibitor MraZ